MDYQVVWVDHQKTEFMMSILENSKMRPFKILNNATDSKNSH
jgi:hypothetical protein